MIHIAIVQPTAPQTPPPDSPPDNEPGSFFNHLENALSETSQEKPQQSSTDSDNTLTVDTRSTKSGEIIPENTETGVSDNKFSIDLTNNNISPFTPNSQYSTDLHLKQTITVAPPVSLDTNTLLPQTGDLDLIPGKDNMPGADSKLLSTPMQQALTRSSDSGKQTLQAQLQQIIDNNNETGTVSITKNNSSYSTRQSGIMTNNIVLPQASGSEQIIATSSNAIEFDFFKTTNAELFGFEGPAEKPNQQLTSVRQDAQHQYYNAKMSMQLGGGDQKETTQNNQQEQTTTPQSQSSSVQNAAASQEQPGSEFTLLAGNSQHVSTTPIPELVRATTVLPSGLVVHEEDIVQQLIERFHVNKRQLDTRINIRLHPAELGELNINLTVKEGSIRAHVIAQSQHVQEILEKSMAKLRTVLEEQGFTVAEISITSQSESVGDFDLFDQQLFSDNNSNPLANKKSRHTNTPFIIDDIEDKEHTSATGVNVRI